MSNADGVFPSIVLILTGWKCGKCFHDSLEETALSVKCLLSFFGNILLSSQSFFGNKEHVGAYVLNNGVLRWNKTV